MNNQYLPLPQYLIMPPSYSYYPNPAHAITYPSYPNMNVMPQKVNCMPGYYMMQNFQMTPQNYMPYLSNGMMKTPNYQQGTMMPHQPRNPTVQGAISPTAPIMPNYQTRLPQPNSHDVLTPRRFCFNGAQLTNGLMPNKKIIPTNSPVNIMPNQQHGIMGSKNATNQLTSENDTGCVEVWSQNQKRILDLVKDLARTYKVIALDTEFPGDPLGSNNNWAEASTQEAYGFIKKNVGCSNIISLG